ncbi:hypothetical protein C4587_01150 [Candidatus Parcubacteria bacterium]|nr:MAG: hypothetical protein C4587_01150 [Candidatus Parcubacteria bacterium]
MEELAGFRPAEQLIAYFLFLIGLACTPIAGRGFAGFNREPTHSTCHAWLGAWMLLVGAYAYRSFPALSTERRIALGLLCTGYLLILPWILERFSRKTEVRARGRQGVEQRENPTRASKTRI